MAPQPNDGASFWSACSIASYFSFSFGTAAGRLRMFLSGRKFVDIAFLLSSRFVIAIDLLILRWHFLCGSVPTVRRPYAADDCLCPLIDVNMLDADMLVAAMPEATECLHLP